MGLEANLFAQHPPVLGIDVKSSPPGVSRAETNGPWQCLGGDQGRRDVMVLVVLRDRAGDPEPKRLALSMISLLAPLRLLFVESYLSLLSPCEYLILTPSPSKSRSSLVKRGRLVDGHGSGAVVFSSWRHDFVAVTTKGPRTSHPNDLWPVRSSLFCNEFYCLCYIYFLRG